VSVNETRQEGTFFDPSQRGTACALIEEVTSVAPAPLRLNFNRLVSTAQRDFAEAQRANAFERAMREMAADPEIQAECRAIARDFAHTELDGLPDD
jgi:hypothetical protein